MKYTKDSKPIGKETQAVDAKNGDKPSEKKKWTNRKQRGEFRTKQKLNMLRQKKQEVEKKLAIAQSATASMGRFDKKAHKEQRKLKVKRRKQYKNFRNASEEVQRNKQVLELVMKSQGAKKLAHSL